MKMMTLEIGGLPACEEVDPVRTSVLCAATRAKVHMDDEPGRNHAWCHKCGQKKELTLTQWQKMELDYAAAKAM